MCGDPSPETFGVSENARRPLAGDFRSVGKCAATPRRGPSECRKMRGDPSPGTFRVSEGVRRGVGGHFARFSRSHKSSNTILSNRIISESDTLSLNFAMMLSEHSLKET